jgi:hypothetical protein
MDLGALIGEWSIDAGFEGTPPPDGLAAIGFDERRQTYLQHYFDSRAASHASTR